MAISALAAAALLGVLVFVDPSSGVASSEQVGATRCLGLTGPLGYLGSSKGATGCMAPTSSKRPDPAVCKEARDAQFWAPPGAQNDDSNWGPSGYIGPSNMTGPPGCPGTTGSFGATGS